MNAALISIDKYKSTVALHFGAAAQDYDQHALLQQKCAQQLLKQIADQSFAIPEGMILEIGCGTGFITQGLIHEFPQYSLEITDLSPQMIQICRANLVIPPTQIDRVIFRVLDGEAIEQPEYSYALIVSGFVLQWFTDPAQSLQRLLSCLQPGGLLCLSFPGQHSFSEWRAVCDRLHLPFTANSLPSPEQLQHQLPAYALTRHLETVPFTTSYASAIEFFRSLKRIGAGVSQSRTQLSPTQLKQLIQTWDKQERLPDDQQTETNAEPRITVTYDVVFWIIQRT